MRMLRLPDPELRPEAHPGFADIAESLKKGSRLLREAGIDLLVLLIPTKFRAMASSVTFDEKTLRQLRPLRLDRATWDVPADRTLAPPLERLCAELDIPFVDATPRLRSSAESGVLVYSPFDTHLSPAGHRVVADLIVETVTTRAN